MGRNAMAPTAVAERVRKLNTASQARVVDPDTDLPGRLGEGQVLPTDLLLSTAGLDEGALPEERIPEFSRLAPLPPSRGGGRNPAPRGCSPACSTSWARPPRTRWTTGWSTPWVPSSST